MHTYKEPELDWIGRPFTPSLRTLMAVQDMLYGNSSRIGVMKFSKKELERRRQRGKRQRQARRTNRLHQN